VIDRGGVRTLVNLGEEDASFDVPDGFRVALISRAPGEAAEGKVVIPPNALAVLSNERD
jgi:hypothetical protein